MNRLLATVLLGVLATPVLAQQNYPDKLIRIMTANAPGGSTSILARMVGDKFTERWGQPTIVDNRPGGNGFIGGDLLAKSAPDGYNLILVTATHVITPLLAPAPYDTIKDFAPVATVTSSEQLMVVNASLPTGNLAEFINYTKSKPGQLNFPTTGNGGAQHIFGEMFALQAGVKIQPVAYKGGAPAVTDLLGGQVQFAIQSPFVIIPHVKNGKLKAIAVTGKSRLSALPDTPTFAEAGMPAFDANNWYGILAPVGTPKPILDKLSAEIARTLGLTDVRKTIQDQGMEPFVSTPDQFAALIRSDIAKYSKVIKTANIKID